MTAIEFNHVSKQYRLGLVSTKTLSHDIRRWWITSILGKEDPYLKIGETNDRATKGTSEYVWALRDIDFKVEQGDVVGIIGKNGAGKSTLLKLLSRVTGPTTGTIRAHGRIGSLLEVGTGFHGEMTGRENIFMNGAILGMTRKEIQAKLDEIIDFSGCERYIDTPVKRYSSGMTVRLGFAVAAFLEPEILVVDEVLAVGDAEFQKKAIGKMKDVSSGQGRTVLFVSHNMTSVKSLCNTGILLENGMIKDMGKIEPIVAHYLRGDSEIDNHKKWNVPELRGGGFELLEIGVRKQKGMWEDIMRVDDDCEIVIRYRLTKDFDNFWITMHFKNEQGEKIFSTSGGGRCYDKEHKAGEYEQICHLPANFFNWGNYTIDIMAITSDGGIQHLIDNKGDDILSFSLENKELAIGQWMGKEPGDITPRFEYTETKIG
ncbi:MAG: ABC transporter ATP-binding protein [Paludibacteraceae bacterium]|nr:ABC transporter ATP-binding protein [Paludibacteraceae bacterium]